LSENSKGLGMSNTKSPVEIAVLCVYLSEVVDRVYECCVMTT